MDFLNLIEIETTIKPFHLFSTSHILTIITILSYIIVTTIFLKKDKFSKYRKKYRYFLFAVIVIEEIMFKLWRLLIEQTPLSANLSLDLCGITIIFLAIMLINKSEKIFEITYFWGLAGATQAILTPDMGQYGFPHFRFLQFFLSHGLILAVIVYFLIVERFKLRKGSIKRAFLITNAYAAIIGVVNYLLDTNYLFLARKPSTPSILDYLGPWPWYILSLEVIALLSFFIVYLPFVIAGVSKTKPTRKKYKILSG